MLSKMLVSGEDINGVQVCTEITEWEGMVMENCVAKTAGRERPPIWCAAYTLTFRALLRTLPWPGPPWR